jgi:hypothetical protein
MNTKHLLQSKTVWLNLIALLLLLWPAARSWMAANPMEPLAALGALNILVRWITSDAVSLFPNGTNEVTPEAAGQDATGENQGRRIPAWLLPAGLAGVMGFPLPGCIPFTPAAAQNMPVKACYIDRSGNQVCYSTAEGLTATVDRRGGK